MAQAADAGAIRGDAPEGDGASVQRRIRTNNRAGHLSLHLLWRGPVRIRCKIRRRLRLAELHAACRWNTRRRRNRQKPWHGSNGSALREMRRASRPCLPGRPRAHRPALLHQLAGAETRSQIVRYGSDLDLVGKAQAEPVEKGKHMLSRAPLRTVKDHVRDSKHWDRYQ